ncbi:hypothetical protein B5X24_HaOG209532 [Helicoverpa armigera]|uniref:Uncharacterized protein n=1 Tax=Helicoverpa armigera TaxID=29058 RepID=A0A2W1BKR0_HELAM|nr:hypothetical protein B5X24_HaOG209532 [Helicoverpa armigera]
MWTNLLAFNERAASILFVLGCVPPVVGFALVTTFVLYKKSLVGCNSSGYCNIINIVHIRQEPRTHCGKLRSRTVIVVGSLYVHT